MTDKEVQALLERNLQLEATLRVSREELTRLRSEVKAYEPREMALSLAVHLIMSYKGDDTAVLKTANKFLTFLNGQE